MRLYSYKLPWRIIETSFNSGFTTGASSQPATYQAPVKSYALVVRGAAEDLITNEVRQRVLERIPNDANVRVKSVTPLKSGGIIIQTRSDRDRKLLSQCGQFSQVGLKVSEPKRLNPRMVIYNLPNGISNEKLMEDIYAKNLAHIIPTKEEFLRSVFVIRRTSKKDSTLSNIIIEVPLKCRDRLLLEGRIFSGWCSYRISNRENIPRCFKCLGYGHQMRDCSKDPLCYKCSSPGHMAANCSAAPRCINCVLRKHPSEHAPTSETCPEVEWRLKLLHSRIDG